ncbi:hypothetical protein PCL_09267 [Purpureocillium lilacinum]|uniref:Myb-like domain-containing protein n=1 Tax=Purpureocillium lilacinum TaxID=33203 RepID=A0A179GSL2_PURLI|nr:hypothetical protein VFPBJ_05704 [Purpureocillium lilacinum]PWI73991.1 hypothetical protein PCL_09267 [Purpureocillium lilacinum]GJN74368.1 hypothetical protein PLICBS_008459 [Purpureocillium lilacinum]
MPPKKIAVNAEGGDAPNGLTENELRFIKALFDNMTQKPDANWDQVAGDLGLKDAKCAKERFRQMSVRHGWRDGTAPTPSPRKPRNGATGPAGDAKVKKTRSPRKKAVAAAPVKKDDDEEEDIKPSVDDEDVKPSVEDEVKEEQEGSDGGV